MIDKNILFIIMLFISIGYKAQVSFTENDFDIYLSIDRSSIVTDANGNKKFNTLLSLDIKKEIVINREYIRVNIGLNNLEKYYYSDTLYMPTNFKQKISQENENYYTLYLGSFPLEKGFYINIYDPQNNKIFTQQR